MRNSNHNETKAFSLCRLRQHLHQNNNDVQVIILSNHEIRFRFRLATEWFLFLTLYVIQTMQLINETEQVVISHFPSALQ